MDINALLGQLTGAASGRLEQNTQMAQRMEQDTQQITQLLNLNTQESAQVIEASASLAAQQAEIDYRTAKAKEGYTALAGMNPDDLNNEFVKSVAAYDANERQRTELETVRSGKMRQAEQLAGVSLLNNPLEYLFAQLQLPTVAAEHNSVLNQEVEATKRRDAAAQNIAARAEMIRQKDSLIAANTADSLLGVSRGKAEAAQKTATIALRQATADNISKLGARALDAYRLGNDSFQIQSDMLNKAISIEQWKTSQAALAEQRAATRAAAQERLKNAKEKDEMEAILNERLAAASAALGYTEPFTVLSIKLLDKDKQDKLVEVAMSGKFGANMAEALDTIRTSGQLGAIRTTNPGMGKFAEYTANGLRMYADEVTREITAGKLPKGTKVANEAAANYSFELENSMGSGAARHNLNSNKWNSDGVFNPYKPQYLVMADEIAGGGMPQLKDNVVVPAITRLRGNLAPGETNLRGKDMENLLMSLSQQVADGNLGLDKAAQDIVKFHATAAAKNLSLFNYTQFGLAQQTSSIVSLPPVTAFGDPIKMDLLNPNDVKLNIARMVTQQRLGSMGILNQRITTNMQNTTIFAPRTPAQ